MNRVIGQFLLALAVTFIVTEPLMACCFTSPVEPVQAATETESPPCHGSRFIDSTTQAQTTPDCPACDADKCSMAMTADQIDTSLLILGGVADNDYDFASSIESTKHSVIYNTAKPATWYKLLNRAATTPLSLKQQLLI